MSIIQHSYQQCNRCLMDTTAIEITFDDSGICNFCTEFLERSGHMIDEDPADQELRLHELVAKIRSSGRGKPYDCIIGVSGGVDSSWTLVEAKRLGLRPLAVHMDNGWNSELAQNNIANLVRGLDVDLHTHVIDWDEYRQLMQAFFDADVIDIELLYDNAMLAVNYQQASQYGLKYILAGTNQATEGMHMPKAWNWFKFDRKNIVGLAKRHGMRGINTFPAIGISDFIWKRFIEKVQWISFLDYLPYNKFYAMDSLENDYGYKRYPFKHYESIFTRFYQGYILPRKFGVDKRRLHLSNLIMFGQISRDEALSQLDGIPFASVADLENDMAYFLKKMKWTQAELDNYMTRPEISHAKYPTEKPLWDLLLGMYSIFKQRVLNNEQ